MEREAYDERARALLTMAADTIPVSSGPVPASRPRRPAWPWVVAAAAVLVVVLLPAVVGPDPHGPSPAAPPVTGSVTVPQTAWMTVEQATRTLGDLGLRVVVDDREPTTGGECRSPEGRVLRSEPAPTSTVDVGTSVRVWISSPASDSHPGGAACLARPGFPTVLGLLDLARFGTTDLTFGPEVTVVSGGSARTLTAAEAGDPAAWGSPSPLTDLVSWLDDVRELDGRLASPSIVTYVDPRGRFSCGAGELFPDRRSVVVRVEHMAEGLDLCRSLRIYSDDAGRIDAVVSEESGSHAEPFDADGRA